MAGQPRVITETTILYGVLIRIGGYSRPRAYMQFMDGRKLSCSIQNRTVAIAMASRLYKSIGVRGVASWDARDHSLLEFHIEELLPDREAQDQAALKGLANLVGEYYERIEDGEPE
jgi:hypothetical protein